MNKCCKLLVKFKPDSIACVKDGKLYFRDPDWILNNANFILFLNYKMAIPGLAKNGEIVSPENNIDFSQYKGMVYVENEMTTTELQCLADQFRQLHIVEYVCLEPVEPIAPPHLADDYEAYITVTSTTPDLTGYQTYLRAGGTSNIYGIDADYAWSIGVTGRGVRCADIEWGNIYDHEDLKADNFIQLLPITNHEYDDHGAAVTSIIFARNNGFGMKGANYDLDYFYGVSELTLGRVGGVAEGLKHLRAGDVFLFEMQTGGPDGKLAPPDLYQPIWDLTKQATDAGIIIVTTAGNGAANLDDPAYAEYRSRGDNGAILVGAGSPVGRNRLSFSTYGSMVHVQGWGENVAAAGYGNLFNGGPLRTYTNTFNGTSSAGPIVTAAVIAIQSWYKANNAGATLSPRSLRNLLIETGTAQGTGGHIGPLPNIKRAIEALQVPSTYSQWVATEVYVAGDRVSWNGSNWEAQWWTKGFEPKVGGAQGTNPWKLLTTV